MLDKMSFRASLEVIGMPLIVLDLTLHVSYDCCAGLLVDRVISIGKLFSELCSILKRP